MDHTGKIPPEVLIDIFKYLSVQELTTNVEKVCFRWKELIRGPLLWSTLEYHPTEYESQQSVSETLQKIPHLKRVNLSDISFSISVLADHISMCKKLQSLKIINESHDPGAVTFLTKLSANCLNITYMIVPHTYLGDEKCVKQIAKLVNLKTLYMKFPDSSFYFGQVSLTSLAPLVNGCPRLECVDVKVGRNLQVFRNFILRKMAQLKIMRIFFTAHGNEILRLLSNCPKLEVLRLSGFEFHPQSVLSFPRFPNLIKLHFGIASAGGCVCRRTFAFARFGNCYDLVEFSSIMRNCPKIQVLDVLCGIAQNYVENLHSLAFLEKLRLADIEMSRESMMQLSKCTQLKYLELRTIKWTDEDSIVLVGNCRRLETLIFDGCDVTNFPYSILPCELENLYLLSFAACLGVNFQAAHGLRRLMPRLEVKLSLTHKVASPI